MLPAVAAWALGLAGEDIWLDNSRVVGGWPTHKHLIRARPAAARRCAVVAHAGRLVAALPLICLHDLRLPPSRHAQGTKLGRLSSDNPFAGVQHFLLKHPDFSIDRSRELYLLTDHPRGYLKRNG